VREELDGLISISDEAIEVLENKVMLELGPVSSATTTTATDAAPPPRAEPSVPPAPGAASPASEPREPIAEPLPAPKRPSTTPPPGATWPVPSRGTGDSPGRVTHPKPHR
jgi:hypothetical protein